MSFLSRAQALAWLRSHAQLPGGVLQLELAARKLGVDQAQRQLDAWDAEGVKFLTPFDEEYPANLRDSKSPPPFVFVRGQLRPQDCQAVAVVGTRACSESGRRRALKLSRALVEAKVTVVSGLALGIDTAAHQGALAGQGRTLAVVGTGLYTVYPPENGRLQERILEQGGAIVSQFWPEFTGRKGGSNFIARNRTMADLSLATVVVEASFRSGARSQAAYVQKTGGRLFLLRSLVSSEKWAAEAAEKPGSRIVDTIEDVLRALPSRNLAP